MEISFNINLAILVFFIFIICIYLLNKWLYIPILNFIDSRNKMMQNDIDKTNNNKKDIADINKEIENILHKAKQEANNIKENALLSAKNIADKKILEAKSDNDKAFALFIEKLLIEKEELRSSLQLRLPSFKADLSEKLKNTKL